eukprot:SAG31_NODE_41249_length_277_cov_0.578652_1_plen_54_part_01
MLYCSCHEIVPAAVAQGRDPLDRVQEIQFEFLGVVAPPQQARFRSRLICVVVLA